MTLRTKGVRVGLGDIIGLVIFGLIVGALGRLIVPGRQRMSILVTILVGIGGAFLGGLIGQALFGRSGGWILAALASALIVFLLARTGRV
jgi:uncharacterized membrane protein YeaQ/YmgE (transglycosylase-associated protein family)